MNNIENLLQRHAEGTLTPEERQELNRLTHRDTVLQAASQGARQIRRRRNAGISAVASIVMVAGALFFLTPHSDNLPANGVTIAQTNTHVVEATAPAQVAPSVDPSTDAVVPAMPSVAPTQEVKVEQMVTPSATEHRTKPKAAPVADIHDELAPDIVREEQPVVACNTSCSPDSVINDIWKFLRA